MGVRSVLAQLNHPLVWTTGSAFAVAGAIYYFKKQKKHIEGDFSKSVNDKVKCMDMSLNPSKPFSNKVVTGFLFLTYVN